MFQRSVSQQLPGKLSKELFNSRRITFEHSTNNQNHPFLSSPSFMTKQAAESNISKIGENLSNDLGRRCRSRSSKRLFEGAHSIKKGETFVKSRKKSGSESQSYLKQQSEFILLKKRTLEQAEMEVNKKLKIKDQLFGRGYSNLKLLIVRENEGYFKEGESTLRNESNIIKKVEDESLGQRSRIEMRQQHKRDLVDEKRDDLKTISKQGIREEQTQVKILMDNHQTRRCAVEGRYSKQKKEKNQQFGEQQSREEQQLNRIENLFLQMSSELKVERQALSKFATKMNAIEKQLYQSQLKKSNQIEHPSSKKKVLTFSNQQVSVIFKADEASHPNIPKDKSKTGQNLKTSEQMGKKSESKVKEIKKKASGSEANGKWQRSEVDTIFCEEINEIDLSVGSSKGKQKKQNLENQVFLAHAINRSSSSRQMDQSFKVQQNSKIVTKERQTGTVKKEKDNRNRIDELKGILLRQAQSDSLLTEIGVVAGYCSKCMKKSKVQWRVAALLFYRYYYDCYKSHTILYDQGLQLGLLKAEDVEKSKKDNDILKQTMMKILNVTKSKGDLKEEYRLIVESSENQTTRLRPLLQVEVRKFISELAKSSDMQNIDIVKCGLRAINALLIIVKLTSDSSTKTIQKIEQMDYSQARSNFNFWSSKLEQILNEFKSD